MKGKRCRKSGVLRLIIIYLGWLTLLLLNVNVSECGQFDKDQNLISQLIGSNVMDTVTSESEPNRISAGTGFGDAQADEQVVTVAPWSTLPAYLTTTPRPAASNNNPWSGWPSFSTTAPTPPWTSWASSTAAPPTTTTPPPQSPNGTPAAATPMQTMEEVLTFSAQLLKEIDSQLDGIISSIVQSEGMDLAQLQLRNSTGEWKQNSDPVQLAQVEGLLQNIGQTVRELVFPNSLAGNDGGVAGKDTASTLPRGKFGLVKNKFGTESYRRTKRNPIMPGWGWDPISIILTLLKVVPFLKLTPAILSSILIIKWAILHKIRVILSVVGLVSLGTLKLITTALLIVIGKVLYLKFHLLWHLYLWKRDRIYHHLHGWGWEPDHHHHHHPLVHLPGLPWGHHDHHHHG